MPAYKIAFMGFRHPHLLAAYELIKNHPRLAIAACCEEDAATRKKLAAEGRIRVTHESFEAMLREVDFQILVAGDVFGERGGVAARALEAGKHVLSDKPICTTLEDLSRLEALLRQRPLAFGAMLDLRDSGALLGARDLIRRGEIGDLRAAGFGGQHPLLLGQRPEWYFEPEKHGGTLNDLAIHALDFLIWVTGQRPARLNAARSWSTAPPGRPGFRNAAQLMLTMENGCGVLGDVSYLSPDSFGYGFPLYWRFTFWGTAGVIEAGYNSERIALYREGERETRLLPAPQSRPGGYLESFLREIEGRPLAGDLTTRQVLACTRLCLRIQEAADKELGSISLAEP